MRILRFSLFFAAAASTVSVAPAAISLVLSVDAVNDASGVDVSFATGSWILVASTTDADFQPIEAGSLSVGDFTAAGGDDLVIFRGDFTTFFTDGVINANPTNLTFANGWGAGDPLALVWFPDGGTARSSAVDGDVYGRYTSTLGEGTSGPWVTPADGTLNQPLELLTSDGNGFFGAGTVSPSSVNAIYSVPEPSASLLGLLAGLLLIRRRR